MTIELARSCNMGNRLTGREWRAGDAVFQLVTLDSGASYELRTSDGSRLHLSDREWRSLHAELNHLFALNQIRAHSLKSLPANHGRPWPRSLDKELTDRWVAREPLKHIAEALQRSRGSIESRLVQLGIVANRHEARNINTPLELPSAVIGTR